MDLDFFALFIGSLVTGFGLVINGFLTAAADHPWMWLLPVLAVIGLVAPVAVKGQNRRRANWR